MSDHCGLMLKADELDWGPKLFKVVDAWQHHMGFK